MFAIIFHLSQYGFSSYERTRAHARALKNIVSMRFKAVLDEMCSPVLMTKWFNVTHRSNHVICKSFGSQREHCEKLMYAII